MANQVENAIEFRSVSKSFGSEKVLDALDLSVEKGRITTVIGPSGVGKSVLLKHVAGLLRPDSGEILFHGRNIAELSWRERRALRGKFSYMFQNSALFDSLTVMENIGLPLSEKAQASRDEIAERVDRLLEVLELGDIAAKHPSQLSGGMQKRVALARALITEPEIILFDEPDTGLDPIRKSAVYDMILRYQKEFGFTAMIVSHEIPDVFGISDRVAMLDDGRIAFEGTGESIQKSDEPRVRRFLDGDSNVPNAD